MDASSPRPRLAPLGEPSSHSMPSTPPSTRTKLAVIALLLGAWLAFFALLGLLSVALAPRTAARHFDFGAPEIVAAMVWTTLTLVIAAYHSRLRTAVPNLFVLVAAHVPMLVIAAVADAFFTSWAV